MITLGVIACLLLMGYIFNSGIESIMTDSNGLKEFGNWWPVIVLLFFAWIVFDSDIVIGITILFCIFYSTDEGKQFVNCMNNPQKTFEICIHEDFNSPDRND